MINFLDLWTDIKKIKLSLYMGKISNSWTVYQKKKKKVIHEQTQELVQQENEPILNL